MPVGFELDSRTLFPAVFCNGSIANRYWARAGGGHYLTLIPIEPRGQPVGPLAAQGHTDRRGPFEEASDRRRPGRVVRRPRHGREFPQRLRRASRPLGDRAPLNAQVVIP